MELDRPHRRPPSTTSDLFICFSSRLSKSSAMRLSSKSMVSPGRTDKPSSLSASLSRRLSRKNGSFRGAQSPMFPPGLSMGKKRGPSIDNPEPSSPKVTCIGQVRVKTKKHGKKMKMNMKKAYRARRSGSNGSKDMSFRRNEGEGCLQHRNQRWVHLPVTICDAVRAFGSDLNCFSNCCFSRSKKRRKEGCRRSRSCSCGGSMCSWFVSLHEGEEVKKRRDIELVLGEEKEVREERGRRAVMERNCSRRRPVFDDLDFSVGEICPEKKKKAIEEEEEEEEEEAAARVSLSVPPKNALILMRCRSDPVKMSALANRFWESPPREGQEQEEETGRRRSSSFNETEKVSRFLKGGEEKQLRLSMEKKEEKRQSTEEVVEEVSEANQESAETELLTRVSIDCREHLWIYGEDEEQNLGIVENPEANEAVTSSGQFVDTVESAPSIQHQPEEEEKEDQIDIQQTAVGKEGIFEQLEEVKTQTRSVGDEESESGEAVMEEEAETSALPDCLLLMMCEPKLSMEVSKETWVCSTDFIRRLPERHRQHHLKKINPGTADDEAVRNSKKKNRAESKAAPPPPGKPPVAARKPPPAPQEGVQPPRSSCSFPIGGKVAGGKDKKQGNAEPLVLTRCKSAPMRSATAKLAAAPPELVFSWKNRKIEPHRPATCGVSARAGVGC